MYLVLRVVLYVQCKAAAKFSVFEADTAQHIR
jgi:hypothetical protein